jgi:WD40 repeat protein
VILWDVASRQPLGTPLEGHNDWVTSLAFSPDGKLLATGGGYPSSIESGENTVILWNLATRQPVGAPLKGHKFKVTSVAFSPDGTLLATGSEDKTAILWDVASGQVVGAPLEGHTDSVTSVAFSADGKLLATGGNDSTVILWDVASRSQVGDPVAAGHDQPVRAVAFSRSGKLVALGFAGSVPLLWDLEKPSWEAVGCAVAVRNLNCSEWREARGEEPYRKTCPALPAPTNCERRRDAGTSEK